MNSRRQQAGAFTLIELLVVIAIIAILAALLLPTLSRGKDQAKRVQCVNNLKETGIAFHAFAHDHGSKFPMEVPAAEGGSLELVQSGSRITGEFYFSHRHFLSLSNDLVTPKMLHCPTDQARVAALTFAAFDNANLSDFINVNGTYLQPGIILAGDRNITNDLNRHPTILQTGLGHVLRWTAELHRKRGNVLFADGHVEEWNEHQLAGNVALRGELVLPTPQPPTAVAGSTAPRPPLARVNPQQPPPQTAPAAVAPERTTTASVSFGNNGAAVVPTPIMAAARQPLTNHHPRILTNVAVADTNPIVAMAAPDLSSTSWLDSMSQALKIPAWLLFLLMLILIAGTAMVLTRRRAA